ncbi:MAG: class I tRNA ligase family protein, partial [bacterium]|nr:class I tRNA ligase family protein [bacterium]
RTTEKRHVTAAQKLWNACQEDIYKKSYEGLYCTGCEQFYLEKDLVGGLCPEHKTKPEHIMEENYFFKLSRYQSFLEKAFANGRIRIHPEKRAHETINFIKEGLQDFSISRSNERAKNWGVGVPDDPAQKMYVWFDALANYISALGYGGADESSFNDFWLDGDILHVIGKGITKFHAIYWPAMLEAAGIFPANGIDILVHGYVTIDGEKISKSLGNTVDPFALVEKYGADALRYFLLREIPTTEDGDYSEEKFAQRYNGDLANGLGNLVSRTATLGEKHALGSLQAVDGPLATVPAEPNLLKRFQLHKCLETLWTHVIRANQYVDEQKPWTQSGENLERTLATLAMLILNIALRLRPFLPHTAEDIFKRFGVDPDAKTTDTSLQLSVKKGEPLFKRISNT